MLDDIVECDLASQHDPHMADTAGSPLLHPTDSELKCPHQKTQENFIFCTLYSVFHICIVKKPQAMDGTGRHLIVRSSTGEINPNQGLAPNLGTGKRYKCKG